MRKKEENMDILAEKAEIMRRVEQVHDVLLIQAIRNLLDFGLSKQDQTDPAFEESINKALQQSNNREVRSHQQVMAEIRARYQK